MSAPSRLSLRFRVPNPPPVFVGRAAALERLATCTGRGPVTVVVGTGGSGKSALVAHALRHLLPDALGTTGPALLVGMRPGDTTDQLRVDLVRALRESAADGNESTFGGALGDPSALMGEAIDRAETAPAIVVLEDLHHGEPAAVAELLRELAAYARDSRWLAVTRQDPQLPELREQTIRLDAMPAGDLEALARACVHDLTDQEVEAAVTAAGGSPWRLRQCLANAGGGALDASALLASLPESAASLLNALSVVDLPLELASVAQVTSVPPPDRVAELARRGLLVTTGDEVRLHDVARSVIEAGLPDDIRERLADQAARGLGGAGQVEATLEAVRLHVDRARPTDASSLLDAEYRRIVDRGYGPRLWQVLSTHPGAAELVTWRLRLAVDLGGGPALEAALDAARPDDLDHRLFWVRARCAAATDEGALQEATSLQEDAAAAGRHDLALAAAIDRGRILLTGGRPAEARDTLQALAPPCRDDVARRDVFLARCQVLLGEYDEGAAAADRLTSQLAELSPQAWAEVQNQRLAAYMNAGRTRAADRVIRALERRFGEGAPPDLRSARRFRLTRCLLAIESGDLTTGRQVLDDLAATIAHAPLERPYYVMNDIRYRLGVGDLAGLDLVVDELVAETEALGNIEMYHWAMLARSLLRLARASHGTDLGWSEAVPQPTGPQAPYLQAFQWQRALRSGEALPESVRPRLDEAPQVIDVQLATTLAVAEDCLHGGDAEAAWAAAGRALRLAREHGWALYEADALVARGDIALVTADEARRGRAVERLSALAERMGSRRYAAHVHFHRAVGSPEGGLDAGALEVLAVLVDVAPVVARRARHLLDPWSARDALDARVVQAVLARSSVQPIVTVTEPSSGGWRSAWGLDLEGRRLWLPDGEWLDLKRHGLLLRLLGTLAAHGGEASKEELAVGAWDQADYHPLRDDKRIQVAMRRLRKVIEVDPSKPTRIVTSSEGYGVGDAEAFRLMGPPAGASGDSGDQPR